MVLSESRKNKTKLFSHSNLACFGKRPNCSHHTESQKFVSCVGDATSLSFASADNGLCNTSCIKLMEQRWSSSVSTAAAEGTLDTYEPVVELLSNPIGAEASRGGSKNAVINMGIRWGHCNMWVFKESSSTPMSGGATDGSVRRMSNTHLYPQNRQRSRGKMQSTQTGLNDRNQCSLGSRGRGVPRWSTMRSRHRRTRSAFSISWGTGLSIA